MKLKLLSIIVPTYNEEHGIAEFYRRTKAVLITLSSKYNHEIIFVNDSSKDNTLGVLKELANSDICVKVISFSRNFGNQIAIAAGLDFANGDLSVIIDDDLQDPPELIPKFIDKWEQGYKVVYGFRPIRENINILFKVIAAVYYRLISLISEVDIPRHVGDFRLIDRTVMDVIRSMREDSKYLRGMISWVGFSQIGIEYVRDKRYAGESKFTFTKYVKFAIQGMSSFSEMPLYLSSVVGFVITLLSFTFLIGLGIMKLMNPSFSIPGWVSLIFIITFFGGIQLISIGIIGIYIGFIYREVKKRPPYIVDQKFNVSD